MTFEEEVRHRLNRIEELLLASIPPSRRPVRLSEAIKAGLPKDVVLQQRVEEAVRLFNQAADTARPKKIKQGFNRLICQDVEQREGRDIVPMSIMRNRMAQRKAFEPVPNSGEVSREKNAEETLDAMESMGYKIITINSIYPGCSKTNVRLLITDEELAKTTGVKKGGVFEDEEVDEEE